MVENSARNLIEIALIEHQAGRLNVARACYTKALEGDSKNTDTLRYFALLAYQEGNLEESLELVDRSISFRNVNPEAYMTKALVLYSMNRLQEALQEVNTAIQQRPNYAVAYGNRGLILQDLGDTVAAENSFSDAISLAPEHPDFRLNRGRLYLVIGRFADAEIDFSSIILSNSNRVVALLGLGESLYRQMKYEQAIDTCCDYLAEFPRDARILSIRARAYTELGSYAMAIRDFAVATRLDEKNSSLALEYVNVLIKANRREEALKVLDSLLEHFPDDSRVHFNRALVLESQERLDEALGAYSNAISANSSCTLSLYNTANLLRSKGRLEEALTTYEKLVQIAPDHSGALNNLGTLLLELNQLEKAHTVLSRAIDISLNDPVPKYNLGVTFHRKGNYELALRNFEELIQTNKDFADSYNGAALALLEQHQFSKAQDYALISLKLNPNSASYKNTLGLVYFAKEDYPSALGLFSNATELAPTNCDYLLNKANTFRELNRLPEALECLERIYIIHNSYPYILGQVISLKLQMCDWSGLEKLQETALEQVERGNKVVTPFALMAFCDDPSLQLIATQTWLEDNFMLSKFFDKKEMRYAAIPQDSDEKIRVAYISSDYYDHATSHLLVELIELHDRACFEVYGLSLNRPRADNVFKRISRAFDQFIIVDELDDESVVKLCRDLRIHIAVDLKGFTKNSRPGIFVRRCAPIQVSWLGYPGTTAIPTMDYLIADHALIKPEEQSFYSETVIRVNTTYQINPSLRRIGKKIFSRLECGLPDSAFVFCCFNNPYKITIEAFSVWMKILHQVQGSVLWLLEDHTDAKENLKSEAAGRGIDPERLVFAARLPMEEHLARHRLADLFLDTWPYNAHTTASDSLWVGTPLITKYGFSFQSRVASSLLMEAGLSDLIARSINEYEWLACRLALSPSFLDETTDKLRKACVKSQLFSPQTFSNELEKVYKSLYRESLQSQI